MAAPLDIQAKLDELKAQAAMKVQLQQQYQAAMAGRYTKDMIPFAQWLAQTQQSKAEGGSARERNLNEFLKDSKVKHKVYHATPKSFNEFKPGGDNPALSGPAIWMTPSKESQPAAHNIRQVPGKPGHMYRTGSNMYTPGTNVMPLHVSIKNPLITHEHTWKQDFKNFGGSPWTLTSDEVNRIKSAGHDGIMHHDKDGNLQEVVAFHPHQVKSAIGNRGTYDPKNPDITKADGGTVLSMDTMRLALNKQGMYSPLEKAAMAVPRTKGTPAEFMAEASKQPGFRADEVADRKVSLPEQKMTKQEFLGHLNKHKLPDLKVETNHSENDETHHDEYTLPGGKNYREVLIRKPGFDRDDELWKAQADLRRETDPYFQQRLQERVDQLEKMKEKYGESFQGVQHHFGGTPGIVASLRLKDRVGPNKEKILHVEEIQSDWHQQGRKHGYRTGEKGSSREELKNLIRSLKEQVYQRAIDAGASPYEASIVRDKTPARELGSMFGKSDLINDLGQKALAEENMVPDAPFKKNWHELALKHALNEAVKGGYHGIAITPGEQQADRYDMSKHIESVMLYTEPGSESAVLRALDHGGDRVISETIPISKLEDYIGKEAAQKILEQKPVVNEQTGLPSEYRSLNGVDLKVGGEGMKGFYDKMLPAYLNKLGKPHGAQVTKIGVPQQWKHSEDKVAANLLSRGINPEKLTAEQWIDARERYRDVEPPPHNLHYFPITDSLRQKIKTEGLPQYAEGGEVDDHESVFFPKKKSKE